MPARLPSLPLPETHSLLADWTAGAGAMRAEARGGQPPGVRGLRALDAQTAMRGTGPQHARPPPERSSAPRRRALRGHRRCGHRVRLARAHRWLEREEPGRFVGTGCCLRSAEWVGWTDLRSGVPIQRGLYCTATTALPHLQRRCPPWPRLSGTTGAQGRAGCVPSSVRPLGPA